MWLTTNIVQIYIYRYIFHYSSGKNIKIIKKNHVIYLFVALKLLVICIINEYLISWKFHAFTTLEYQVINCISSLILSVFWITWEINDSKTITFIYTQSLITKYRTVRPCIIYIVFCYIAIIMVKQFVKYPENQMFKIIFFSTVIVYLRYNKKGYIFLKMFAKIPAN